VSDRPDPSVSVIFPTRRRREYLRVALESVAPQVRAHAGEMLIVEDDPADPATERLAAEYGARYLAHGAARGLNAARNTGGAAAGGALLCFLDDDVRAWPGWLAALLAADAACPDHLVFGGPIRADLENTNLHACGRESLPITTLDLGSEDRDAEFAWGANLTLRRRGFELARGFDENLGLYGDEEDLQRRLKAAGGRVRYVAAAGVDHRRAGSDARLKALSRAAYTRGRNSRRYDGRKRTVPSLQAEVRTLAGCLVHAVRHRCGNGIVLTAHTIGRLREALAPLATPPAAADPDFLSGESGTLNRRSRASGAARDAVADVLTAPERRKLRRAARREPPRRRILVVSIARPEHAAATAATVAELETSRHDVAIRVIAPRRGAGKWANLNASLAAQPPDSEDWLLILDDDIVLPAHFLDPFVFAAERFGLRLAQPAHAYNSNAAWRVTRRRPGVLARTTSFVEIGPVTALHSDTFSTLVPFPDLHMGWGLDVHWGALAAERGWPVGIVDATPIRHTRPVASEYPRERAVAEAQTFLADRPYVSRQQARQTLATHHDWR
jgi:GT2 family glycosyltransferase